MSVRGKTVGGRYDRAYSDPDLGSAFEILGVLELQTSGAPTNESSARGFFGNFAFALAFALA